MTVDIFVGILTFTRRWSVRQWGGVRYTLLPSCSLLIPPAIALADCLAHVFRLGLKPLDQEGGESDRPLDRGWRSRCRPLGLREFPNPPQMPCEDPVDGLMSGTGWVRCGWNDNRFGIGQTLTRYQMVTFLCLLTIGRTSRLGGRSTNG